MRWWPRRCSACCWSAATGLRFRPAPNRATSVESGLRRRFLLWVRGAAAGFGPPGPRLLGPSSDGGSGCLCGREALAELNAFWRQRGPGRGPPVIAETGTAERPTMACSAGLSAAGWAALSRRGSFVLGFGPRAVRASRSGVRTWRGGAADPGCRPVGHWCTALVDQLLIAMRSALRSDHRWRLLLKLPLMWLAIASWGVVGAALAEAACAVFGRLWAGPTPDDPCHGRQRAGLVQDATWPPRPLVAFRRR